MGCGCSSDKDGGGLPNQKYEILNTQTKHIYLERNVLYLRNYLSTLGISVDIKNNCMKLLSKDLQGLIASAGGDEDSVLSDIVGQVIDNSTNLASLFKAGIKFVNLIKQNNIDHRRSESCRYLFKEIEKLGKEKFIIKELDNIKRSYYLYSILAAFRYSNVAYRLNFRDSILEVQQELIQELNPL